MKRAWGLLILIVLLLSGVSASCSETQIDINTASAEELDKITGIGPVYAERIIENRSYESLDDLLRVKGIGDKTLEKIKAEGLACAGGNEKTEEEKDDEKDTEEEETGEEEIADGEETEAEEESGEITELPKITAALHGFNT